MTTTIDEGVCPKCGSIAMYSQDNNSGDTDLFCPTCRFSCINGVGGLSMIDAIEMLTGITPDGIEENCGSIWFSKNDKWYFVTYGECEDEDNE